MAVGLGVGGSSPARICILAAASCLGIVRAAEKFRPGVVGACLIWWERDIVRWWTADSSALGSSQDVKPVKKGFRLNSATQKYISLKPSVNPRPDTVFLHLRSDRGGWCDPPLGVSKRRVVELSGKNQQIALGEYSRLVVLFLVLGQYMTQLWQVKGEIFGNSMIFQLESISAKQSIVAAWDLHQRVPRSILHRMRCFDASRLNI